MTDGPATVTSVQAEPYPWRRLHPLSPLLRGGLFLLVVAGILVANLRDRLFELFFSQEIVDALGPNEGDLVDYVVGQRLVVWVLLGVALVIALIIGLSWLSWRFSTFRITAEAVESRRGVLFRQHRRAPLERIQSVNLQRSLLARLIGLTQVDVQTAGQGGKVALQYLGHKDAKLVREEILRAARIAGTGRSDAAADAAEPSVTEDTGGTEARSSHSQSQQVPVAAVDFSGRSYSETPSMIDARLRDLADFDIDPNARDRGTLIQVPVGRLIASILLGSEMLIVLILAVAIVVTTFWSTVFLLATLLPLALVLVSMMISQFNKGFNFVLSRADDGVRVGAGLTSTLTETIPFGRVHAVEARQPLGWRPFGWWKVRITTAGYSAAQAGQNKLQNVVLPVGEVDDVVRVFETLMHPTVEATEHDTDDLPARARAEWESALRGAGEEFLPAAARSGPLLWFGRRRAGLRIEQADGPHPSLRIRRGWFTRSLAVMPVVRAQSVQLGRPFLHRLLGLATIQAHTVLGPIHMQMRGIELDQARAAFDELASTVIRVQSAEALELRHATDEHRDDS